jgi:uncharacterized protein (TIGR02231 family)
MLKSTSILLCLLTVLTAYTQNKPANAKTTINEVTVFLSGAEVHRTGKVTVVPGVNEIKVIGLSPSVNGNSIQASLSNDNLTILSVDHKMNYLTENKFAPRIETIKDSLEDMALKYKIRESHERVYKEEKSMLITNKAIGGSDSGVDIEDLMEMADFYRQRLTEIETKLLDIVSEKAQITKTITKLNAHLNQLNAKKTNHTSEVTIKVSSKQRMITDVELSYIVSKAGWMPKYDLRANNTTDPIGLTYKADVFQNTGIDWKNVNLTLSTGNPTVNNTQPELSTWFLYFQQQFKKKEFRYGNKRDALANAQHSRDFEENYKPQLYEVQGSSSISKSSANFTQFTENAVNAEFAIQIPYSILSNNESATVEIQKYNLPAEFKHYAAPKLDNDAFLLARITDWGEYHLLPGDVNVYFEGTSVGTSYLNTAITDDTLDVSMGRDKGVVVQRDRIKDFCKTTGFGANKKTIRGYKLIVKNNKSTASELILLDQVPVSSNKQIEVTIEDNGGAKHNQENGQLKWVLNLAPGESREITYKFTVKYPKDKIVGNL